MSARLPRRSFATPFVVTLAAALPVGACYVQSQPASAPPRGTTHAADDRATHDRATHDHATHDHRDGHRTGQPTHTNPPRPAGPQVPPGTPTTNSATTGAGSTTNAGVGGPPPRSTDPVVVSNPPPPQPAPPTNPVKVSKVDRRWTVMKRSGTCRAFLDSSCPPVAKGQPIPPCNPPPPQAYTCPQTLADNASLKIVQRAGQSTCFVDYGPMSCPKGAICNPPPPQKVSCPR